MMVLGYRGSSEQNPRYSLLSKSKGVFGILTILKQRVEYILSELLELFTLKQTEKEKVCAYLDSKKML